MIQKELVNEIRKKVFLTDEAAKIGPVDKRDNYYRCNCPLCGSKAAIIDANRGLFKCINSLCGAEGNVIDFVKLRDNTTYRKAIEKILYEHPEIKESKEFAQNVEDSNVSDYKRQQLLDINRAITNFFRNHLAFSSAKKANEYLSNTRKLSSSTIAEFGIGYVPNCDALVKDLLLKYDKDLILQTGMFYMKDGNIRGKFWNRITFPITDQWNNIISFGGRVMDDTKPKYLNGADSLLFNKRQHLFGLGQALSNSPDRRVDNIILCEGYMDVISMHQAGFKNCVASLGTALTYQQCCLLKECTNVVYTAYDSDEAGKKASSKAAELLLKLGITVKRIDLSPYKDPDEFIKNLGTNALIKRINSAETIAK